MKLFVKIICTLLTVLTLSVGTSVIGGGGERRTDNTDGARTYLVLGLDDAAGNTDVISLLHISGGGISVLQIPRDTYITYEGEGMKINGLYPKMLGAGGTRDEALSTLSSLVSDIFSTKIDGYMAATTDGIRSLIDRLGGVDIMLSETVDLGDGTVYPAGENHLDSGEAIRLIRHRATYKRADLDRLNIQGLFYRAIFNKVLSAPLGTLVGAYNDIASSGSVNIPLSDGLRLYGNRESLRKAVPECVMLSGEAREIGGVWYYLVRRDSSARIAVSIFGVDLDKFDKNKILLNKSGQSFVNIYYS